METVKKKKKQIRLIKFGPKCGLVVRNNKKRPISKKGPDVVEISSSDNISNSTPNSLHSVGSLANVGQKATFDVHYGEQSMDSDIIRCNNRILKNLMDDGGRIWREVANLGVVSSEPQAMVRRRIRDLECANKEEKRLLWKCLLELKSKFTDGEWVIGGNFNAVKNNRERVESSSYVNSREWREFAAFIEETNHVDVPCKGKRYSWFCGVGRSKSRFDRFLISDNIINRWGVMGQRIEERGALDHCPVWLVVDTKNWGPKPFKFNNEWFRNKDFLRYVEEESAAIQVSGRGDFVLKEKLRLLKPRLRWWNTNVFGSFDLDIDNEVKNINKVDDLNNVREGDLEDLRRGTSRFWINFKIKENMLIQRSRIRWLINGDTNNRFFHRVMKHRLRKTHIGGVVSNGTMVESVEEVNKEVYNHFANKFVEEVPNMPILNGAVLKSIDREESDYIESPFTEEEVKEVIWNCDGSKSPRPDGYSILFVKKCWPFIKKDIMSCFRDFHNGAVLSKSITSTFLALIRKKDNPLDLDDYRLICLVGSIYKIILKVLAGRMKCIFKLLQNYLKT
ncbi:uncharacterized protein LOC131614072 [Vicia villosa]|uniref:uncharacterized protein LOC131614072 n=1 Tax=Vicia villosa TaxID=3911 RepID=UPI00273B53BC|nr:uncharacterized protein LOC131614072 [Vicia villosa]